MIVCSTPVFSNVLKIVDFQNCEIPPNHFSKWFGISLEYWQNSGVFKEKLGVMDTSRNPEIQKISDVRSSPNQIEKLRVRNEAE